MALGQSVESFKGPAINRRLVSQQEGVLAVESGVQAHQVARATSWPSIQSKCRAVTFFFGAVTLVTQPQGKAILGTHAVLGHRGTKQEGGRCLLRAGHSRFGHQGCVVCWPAPCPRSLDL